MTALSFSVPKSSKTRRTAIDLRLNAKIDPTKTNAIRSRFERELVRRFRKVALEAYEYILNEQNLKPRLKANAYDYPQAEDKVNKFMRWVRRAQDRGILEVTEGTSTRSGSRRWSDLYIKSAYQKGLASAYGNIRAAGVGVSDSYVDRAFFRPIHADRAGLIYTRAYNDLEGITTAIDTRLSSVLAQGMIEGVGVQQIARNIRDSVEGIGITRSRKLARTEVVRAHAEATLNSYEEAQIEGVDVESEFSTSQDNKVCPKCSELEGQTYTLEEARGIIPVHPNCRCAWLPVVPVDMKGREIG